MTRQHRDIHGDGGREYEVYRMAPPGSTWSAITGVLCPVDGCGQALVWYEAGYVPGYRVCMTVIDAEDGEFDHQTLRHRFALDLHPDREGEWALIRDECCEDHGVAT